MTAAIALPSLFLSDDEESVAARLRGQVKRFARRNRFKEEYYEGRQRVQHLDIAVPPSLRNLAVAVGWPGTVVDVLEERLDWLGWTAPSGDVIGLDDVFRENLLDLESGRAHLDTLITGTDFVTVGRGDAGEPEVLVTVESASTATVEWDHRKRRAAAGLSQTLDERGRVVMESLYLPDVTVRFEPDSKSGRMTVVDRDSHDMGRVPMVRLVNRDRASRVNGRSEMTRPVRYYTDAAIRTMLGMEINREFYTAPQRYALGATPEQFGVNEDSTDEDKARAGWTVAMGRLNIIPPREDDPSAKIEMGQFTPSPPTPYIEQIRAYSQLIAAESGMPATYLGFVTDNPASADSIRQLEYRLVKRAERRQVTFGQAWREVAFLALLVRDGAVDVDQFHPIAAKWRDPSTPTRAASADEATKLISSGVLPPDSPVTYDRVGLSQQDQAQLAADRRRAGVRELLRRLPAQSQGGPGADAG